MAAEPTGAVAPKHVPTGHDAFNSLRHVRLEGGFTLRTWDTNRTRGGKSMLGYELRDPVGSVLFQGEDFGCSPLHAIDSDDALRGILGFLTLRPGDTEREYFADYTEAQMDFATEHGEWLGFLYSEEGEGKFTDLDSEDGAS